MIDLNKKYSFININGTTFKNFSRYSTISTKKNVSSFFKKEILGVSNGKVFFYGAARMGIYEFIKSPNPSGKYNYQLFHIVKEHLRYTQTKKV